jgi:nuclear pore complex protein Nup155
MPSGDPREATYERRVQCYDLVLDSLSVFESKAGGDGDPNTVQSHAYDLAFASSDGMFHSMLYDWLINRRLADDLLEVCLWNVHVPCLMHC